VWRSRASGEVAGEVGRRSVGDRRPLDLPLRRGSVRPCPGFGWALSPGSRQIRPGCRVL